MTVYERIKYLREKRNMSQQDLALKVGYKDKSAISKVERGDRDINQSMLIKYADALGTTVSYLMGWAEPEPLNLQLFGSSESIVDDVTDKEKELLNLFRQVPEEQQQLVIQMVRAAVGK